MFMHAICRKPGRNAASGLTTSELGAQNTELLAQQHSAYVNTLSRLGLQVEVLEPLEAFPDAYFVEDAAVFTPAAVVITRPGAPERLGEVEALAPVLARYRAIEKIEPPGLLDGGDVLRIDKHFFIGISKRTNREGAEQLTRILKRQGCTSTAVPVVKGLHFKSSVNWVGGRFLVVTEAFAQCSELDAFEKVVVSPDEEYAANTLLVNGHLLTPKGFPNTLEGLRRLGLPTIELETSEIHKMDGGLTCMSLRF